MASLAGAVLISFSLGGCATQPRQDSLTSPVAIESVEATIARTLNDPQPPAHLDKPGRARWWVAHNRERRRRDAKARETLEAQRRVFQTQMRALQFQRDQQEKLARQGKLDDDYSSRIATPSGSAFTLSQRSNPFRPRNESARAASSATPSGPIFQISRLAGQPLSVVESVLGPTQGVEVVPESEAPLQGNLVGEHRRFSDGRTWEVEVQFYQSKAVAFTLVMEATPAASAEEVMARIGVDVRQLNLARSTAKSRYWAGRVGGFEFSELSAHTGGGDGWTVAQAFIAR